MICKDCNLEMQADIQRLREGKAIVLFTCKNKACSLWSVTLTEDVFKALTDEQVQDYREMVANLKKRFQS